MAHPTGDKQGKKPLKPLDDEASPVWVRILGAVVAEILVGAVLFIIFGSLSGHGWWPGATHLTIGRTWTRSPPQQ